MEDKEKKLQKEQELLTLVSAFCKEKLNEEYNLLCSKMIKKLGRKRTVPFMTGRLEIWAASIVYTIGMLNFLFDKSFEPYISSNEIHEYFGTKSSTVSTKSRLLRDMLELSRFDDEFSTRHIIDNNPFNQFVLVNDIIVDLDSIPLEYQEMVKQARARGEDISFRTS
jgi:hypothetical protein